MATPDKPSPTLAERIVEAELAYYRQTQWLVIGAQEALDWYDKLPIQAKAELRLVPPAQWLRLPALKQAVLEKRGYSMRGYMAAYLTIDEFSRWMDSEKRAAV